MKKAILMSFSPYYYYLIGEGIKKIEVRKKTACDPDWNKVVECYMTKDKRSFNRIPKEFQEKYRAHMGKVGMRFVCERTEEYHTEFYENDDVYQEIRSYWLDEDREEDWHIVTTNERANPDDCDLLKKACLTFNEIKRYIGYGSDKFYALYISDLKIYDKPKILREFFKVGKYAACIYGDKTCIYSRITDFCRTCEFEIRRPPQSWFYVEEI